MSFSIPVSPRLISPGPYNSKYPNCVSTSIIDGNMLIAYATANKIIVSTYDLTDSIVLIGHSESSLVTAVAWDTASNKIISSSTDHDIIIWEPHGFTWAASYKFKISSKPSCLSWSVCGRRFCIGSSSFAIYQLNEHPAPDIADSYVQNVFKDASPVSIAQFSPDGRLILTLRKDRRNIMIWHKRTESVNDYRRILVPQPSPIRTVSWRIPESKYGSSCFLTLGLDGVVRIFSETGVSEILGFDVVASIGPSHNSIASSFVSPNYVSSKIDFNMSFAHGHGHLKLIDGDLRSPPSSKPIKSVTSEIIVVDDKGKVSIWKIDNLGSSVRIAPKLVREGKIGNLGNLGGIRIVYTGKVGDEFFMVVRSRRMGVLAVLEKKGPGLNLAGMIKGHSSKIRDLRVSRGKILTIDESGTIFEWKWINSNAAEVSFPMRFTGVIGERVSKSDFYEDGQILTFDGSIFRISGRSSHFRYQGKGNIIDVRTVKFRDMTAIVHLTDERLTVICIKDDRCEELFTYEGKSGFTYGITPSLGKLSEMSGSPVYLFGDVFGSVYSLSLEGNIRELIFLGKPIKIIECSSPGLLFVATPEKVHIVRVLANPPNQLYQEIDVNSTSIASIPGGILAVGFDKGIDFYYPVPYPGGSYKYTKFSRSDISDVRNLEWNPDGTLIVTSENSISCFTKYADTSPFDIGYVRVQTLHLTLSLEKGNLEESEFSPAVILPIVITGRLSIVVEMISEYLSNTKSHHFTKRFLYFPRESPTSIPQLSKFDVPDHSRVFLNHILSVIETLETLSLGKLSDESRLIVRALTAAPNLTLPFDLINIAVTSPDQLALLQIIKVSNWQIADRAGIGFWINDHETLVSLISKICVHSFPDNPSISILLAVAAGKLRLIRELYTSIGDDTRAEFFSRDFTSPKPKVSAEKNGYSALSKSDKATAAAMFILAGKLEPAIRVISENYHLTYLVLRLIEKVTGPFTFMYINEYLKPAGYKARDIAALNYFERVTKTGNLTRGRPSQVNPGHINHNSSLFGDIRFSIYDTLNLDVNDTTDLMSSLMMQGKGILSAMLIPKINSKPLPETNIISEYSENSEEISNQGTGFNFGFGKFDVESDDSLSDDYSEIGKSDNVNWHCQAIALSSAYNRFMSILNVMEPSNSILNHFSLEAEFETINLISLLPVIREGIEEACQRRGFQLRHMIVLPSNERKLFLETLLQSLQTFPKHPSPQQIAQISRTVTFLSRYMFTSEPFPREILSSIPVIDSETLYNTLHSHSLLSPAKADYSFPHIPEGFPWMSFYKLPSSCPKLKPSQSMMCPKFITLREPVRLSRLNSEVTSLLSLPDGFRLIAASFSGLARVSKVPTTTFIPDSISYPFSLALIPSGFLVGDYQGNITFNSIDGGFSKLVYTGKGNCCSLLKYDSTSRSFAAVHGPRVSLFTLTNPEPFIIFNEVADVQCICYTRGGFMAVSTPGRVGLWDALLPYPSARVACFDVSRSLGNVLSMVFSSLTNTLYLGTGKGFIISVDSGTFSIKLSKRTHSKGVHALSFDEAETYLFSGSGDGCVRVWDPETLSQVTGRIDVHRQKVMYDTEKFRVYGVTAIEVRGNTVFTAGVDGVINYMTLQM